jgi:hypothetical protein
MFGVSPAEVSEWLGDRIGKVIVISIGIFALGYFSGQRFG